MKTAIITSATFDIYGAAIISRLVAQGRPPACVICVRPSRWREIRGYVQRHGLRGTVQKVLQVLNLRAWPGSNHWGVMARYAAQHGMQDWKTPLPTLCRKHGIELVRVKQLNAERTVRFIRDQGIELLLNAGSELFRADVINSPTCGVLNVHKGILPAYRGYHVVEWSVLSGHQPGVSLHFVDTGLDTGDVLRVAPIPIDSADDIDTIRAKSYPLQVDLMVWGVTQLAAGNATRTPQRKTDGKQYFAMHPRLKAVAQKRLGRRLTLPELVESSTNPSQNLDSKAA